MVRPHFGWYIFLAFFSPLVAVEFVKLFVDVFSNLKEFIWFGVGLVAYWPLEHYVLKKNTNFIKTNSHETNHMIVSLT